MPFFWSKANNDTLISILEIHEEKSNTMNFFYIMILQAWQMNSGLARQQTLDSSNGRKRQAEVFRSYVGR